MDARNSPLLTRRESLVGLAAWVAAAAASVPFTQSPQAGAAEILNELAEFPADVPLATLRRVLSGLDCRKDHRTDYFCTGTASAFRVSIMTRGTQVRSINVVQTDTKALDLESWAKGRYGADFETCISWGGYTAPPTQYTILRWKHARPEATVSITTGPRQLLRRELLLTSYAPGEVGPSCAG